MFQSSEPLPVVGLSTTFVNKTAIHVAWTVDSSSTQDLFIVSQVNYYRGFDKSDWYVGWGCYYMSNMFCHNLVDFPQVQHGEVTAGETRSTISTNVEVNNVILLGLGAGTNYEITVTASSSGQTGDSEIIQEATSKEE